MSAYITNEQIGKLLSIKKSKLFVFFTVQIIIDIVEQTPPFWKAIESAPAATAINTEISKLIKAFEGLSEDARTLVNQAWGGNDFLFNDGLDMIPILLGRLGKINAQKSLNQRQQIGDDVYYLFNEFGITPTTYEEGSFVECLIIIIEACELKHDAHRLARDTLKRYS